ncbi:hypothetical protein Ddye_019703 [Dipteronia dyeriana]|uniref:F-box associated beta-propeller type 1 domain-containing protein n=1 Tax=Dipteronia dyeriana TaxID=168575 RepID=A0AAD9WVW6_9ROSI|nr:hypothetical protein Ddye_019703 [Dipteronia dyeriana]
MILEGKRRGLVSVVGSCNVKGVPLNGALHWLAYHDRASPNLFIVAFDLDEEKFKTFPLPDNVITKDNHDWAYSFGICGGCLCLLIEKEYPALQLWIMKEYCVKRSWTKISTVEGHRSLAELDYEQVLFWDPIDAEFKNIYEEGVETSDNIPYVESLVSPHYRNDFTNDGKKILPFLYLI